VNEGHEELDLILRSGALEEPSVVLLKDYERAWSGSVIDSSNSCPPSCMSPGQHCLP
jgi:hypothetical protein